jgi:hypothetical protein
MTDPTFNLSAFAERLFNEKRMLSLAGKIGRARDLHSLCTDLVMALESLDALEQQLKVPADPDDHQKLITESALLNNSIILYVRATKTESRERGGFDIRSRFSASEKRVHKEICDLRDHAVAHFGSGGSYEGDWQAELVILQMKGDEAKVGVVTRRQTVDRNLVERISNQSKHALLILRDVYNERLNDITSEINKAVEADANFYREILPHPLNLDVFLKSTTAADAARGSFGTGFAKGSVSHR